MKNFIKKLTLSQFYTDVRGIELFRRAVGAFSIYVLFAKILFNFTDLFSAKKVISLDSLKLFADNYSTGYWSFHWIVDSWILNYGILITMAFLSVALLLEFYPKISAFVLWILYISLNNYLFLFSIQEIWIMQSLLFVTIFLNKNEQKNYVNLMVLLLASSFVIFGYVKDVFVSQLYPEHQILYWLGIGATLLVPIAYVNHLSRSIINLIIIALIAYWAVITEEYLFNFVHAFLWLVLMPREFWNVLKIPKYDLDTKLLTPGGVIVPILFGLLIFQLNTSSFLSSSKYYEQYNTVKYKVGIRSGAENAHSFLTNMTGFGLNYVNFDKVEFPVFKRFMVEKNKKFIYLDEQYPVLKKGYWQNFINKYPTLIKFDKNQLVLHNFLDYLCKKQKDSEVNLFILDSNIQFNTESKVFVYTKVCPKK